MTKRFRTAGMSEHRNKLLELRQKSEDTSLSIQERIRTLFELSDYERGPDIAVILRKIRNLYELEHKL